MTLKKTHLISLCIILILTLTITCFPFEYSFGVMSEVNEPSMTTSFQSSNTFTDEYVKCNIKGSTMTIKCKTKLPTYEFRIALYGVYPPTGYTPPEIFVPAMEGNQFTCNLNFKELNVPNGEYYIYISRIQNPGDAYESNPPNGALYKNLPIRVKKFIPRVLKYNDVIAENDKIQAIGEGYDPNWYLDTSLDDIRFVLKNPATQVFSDMTSYKIDFIHSLSDQVTAGAYSDYDKLLKLYEYVASNFYYDSMAYSTYTPTYSRQFVHPYDNLYNFVNKVQSVNSSNMGQVATTCQGFSAMVIAMARCQNIPSRLVYGHRLTPPKNNWGTENNIGHRDHWWLEAYVDNRWIMVDPTIGTNNKWNSKTDVWQYYGLTNYTYFDPSDEQFAVSHIYHNIYPDKRFGYLLSNPDEITKLTAFLNTTSNGKTNGLRLNDAYYPDDKKTWGDGRKTHFMTDGYGNTTQIQWSHQGFAGTMDLSDFTKMRLLSSQNNRLTSVNLSGCRSLSEVYLGGNPLTDATIYIKNRNVNINATENGVFSLEYDKSHSKSLELVLKPNIGYKVKSLTNNYNGKSVTNNRYYSFNPTSSSYTVNFGLDPNSYECYLYSYNNDADYRPFNKAVQKRLTELGYFAGKVDGYFAEDTEDAVENFQLVNGITADGRVNQKTWKAIFTSSTAKKPADEIIAEIASFNEIKIYAEAAATKGKIKITWLTAMLQPDELTETPTPTPTVQPPVPQESVQVDGYQVWKSTRSNSNFVRKATTKNLSYTNTKDLKKGRTYYYRVRAFKNINGKTYYSQWTQVSARAK
ncbi:MAG: transglutaminase domain-containing protein [Anaerovoracaceae bacterium]